MWYGSTITNPNAKFEKAVGKRAAAKFEKEHKELLSCIYYEPFFGSFRTLKTQLIKNNKSIEFTEKAKE